MGLRSHAYYFALQALLLACDGALVLNFTSSDLGKCMKDQPLVLNTLLLGKVQEGRQVPGLHRAFDLYAGSN